VQFQDEKDVKQIDRTENAKEKEAESDGNVEDDAQNLDPMMRTETETKDESLHLVWQDSPSDSDTSDQATEARLIE
jgi:hypothetical protein